MERWEKKESSKNVEKWILSYHVDRWREIILTFAMTF